MPLVRPADPVPALALVPRRPPDGPVLFAGLRGASAGSAAIAWSSLIYGGVAAGLVVLGWLFGDSTWWLFIANLTVFYWLAPSMVLSAVAALRRWWFVAVVCLVGSTVWLSTFGPLFVGRAQQVPDTGAVRVATYNISPQPDIAHVVRLVERTQPDVLLLQEVLPEARDALTGALRTLPYHRFAPVNQTAPGGGGTAVLSRVPIVGVRPITGLPPGGRPTDLVALDTGRGVVTVVSLHLTSPCSACVRELEHVSLRKSLEGEARERRREVQRVAAVLPEGPVVVGGDLNSSTRNVPRRHLLSTGLVDLHRAVGSGPGFTRFRWHGLVRIDWLLASRDLTPLREWVERRDGSDHRPVVADLALPPGT